MVCETFSPTKLPKSTQTFPVPDSNQTFGSGHTWILRCKVGYPNAIQNTNTQVDKSKHTWKYQALCVDLLICAPNTLLKEVKWAKATICLSTCQYQQTKLIVHGYSNHILLNYGHLWSLLWLLPQPSYLARLTRKWHSGLDWRGDSLFCWNKALTPTQTH